MLWSEIELLSAHMRVNEIRKGAVAIVPFDHARKPESIGLVLMHDLAGDGCNQGITGHTSCLRSEVRTPMDVSGTLLSDRAGNADAAFDRWQNWLGHGYSPLFSQADPLPLLRYWRPMMSRLLSLSTLPFLFAAIGLCYIRSLLGILRGSNGRHARSMRATDVRHNSQRIEDEMTYLALAIGLIWLGVALFLRGQALNLQRLTLNNLAPGVNAGGPEYNALRRILDSQAKPELYNAEGQKYLRKLKQNAWLFGAWMLAGFLGLIWLSPHVITQ
jgi:hypothetical protein